MYNNFDWKCFSSPLCLIENEALKQAKTYESLENLGGYQNFSSSGEYIEKFFPLLQNEYYSSLKREMKRYGEALRNDESYPLTYRVILDEDHDISKEQGIRLNILKEFDFMPQTKIDQEKLWKYQHYARYLVFKQQSQYLGVVYTQNDNETVYCSLAIYKKKKEERYLILPHSYDAVEMLNFKNIKTNQIKLIEYRNRIIDQDQVRQQRQSYSLKTIWDQRLDVYFQPICSLSTYLNEKETLFTISSCPFKELLLQPSTKLNNVDQTDFAILTKIQRNKYFTNQQFLKYFDADQIEAISDAVDYSKKITIIKGPPGTGKTQTILGICAIMSELLLPHYSQDQQQGSILILAKSNSVVNDLVRKLLKNSQEKGQIIYCEENQPKHLKILRFGRPELCESDIYRQSLEIRSQDYFFMNKFKVRKDELFSKYITPEIEEKQQKKKMQKFEEFQNTNYPSNPYFSLFSLLEYIQYLNDFFTINSEILEAYGNLYLQLDQFLSNNQKEYSDIEQKFLTQCNVIVSTLNSCSKQCLEQYFEKVKFRMCIVDEAPTALEPSLLIPFVKYKNLEKIVLLGDTKQLDPIVVSNVSKNYGYNKSLFERLSNSLKKNSFKLRHQYRQMPNLAEITSVMFYRNTLKNGINLMQFPDYIKNKVKRNRLFFNTPSQTEQRDETSKKNDFECEAIIKLVNYLLGDCKNLNECHKKITIISAYAAQRENIRVKLEQLKLSNIVELDTVDSFQGKENDIIILSLVRSNQETGFLSDKKRTNVALSRAKYCQYIFGTKQTLNRNFKNWNKIIKIMQREREIIDYDSEDLQNPNFFKEQLNPQKYEQQ